MNNDDAETPVCCQKTKKRLLHCHTCCAQFVVRISSPVSVVELVAVVQLRGACAKLPYSGCTVALRLRAGPPSARETFSERGWEYLPDTKGEIQLLVYLWMGALLVRGPVHIIFIYFVHTYMPGARKKGHVECLLIRVILHVRTGKQHQQYQPFNPYRTPVPFWGQSTHNLSLCPHIWDCGPKRVNNKQRSLSINSKTWGDGRAESVKHVPGNIYQVHAQYSAFIYLYTQQYSTLLLHYVYSKHT